MKKVHKVINLQIFDFERHPFAYAVASKKNQFGYSYKKICYLDGKKVKESPAFDSVSDEAIYWLAFGVNNSQEKTLSKRIKKITKKADYKSKIEGKVGFQIYFEDGSVISYSGAKKEDAKKLVFKYINKNNK